MAGPSRPPRRHVARRAPAPGPPGSTGPASDGVSCANVRIAVSARLDGEEPGVAAELLRDHLDVCSGCAQLAADVDRLHRGARLVPAPRVPDLTGQVLTAVDAVGRRTARRRRELRSLVALAGVVQLLVGLGALLGVAGVAVGPALHAGRDLGALQVALAVGLLAAAWHPWRAAGLLPAVTALVAVTVTTAGVDVANGVVSLTGELVHLGEAVGVVALWALRRELPVGSRAPAAMGTA